MQPTDGDVEDLVDQKGQPYAKLKTAFLFRKTYDEACKCKPHAWEQVSLERHRIYALDARLKKGDKSVVAELGELRQKQAQAFAAAKKLPQGAAAVRAAKAADAKRQVAAAAGSGGPSPEGTAAPERAGSPELATVSSGETLAEPAAEIETPPPRPVTKQAAATRQNAMRLGRGEPAPKPARSVAPASRTANDWASRVFNQN